MDTLSHAGWGYVVSKHKRMAWWGALAGAMPDLLFFIPSRLEIVFERGFRVAATIGGEQRVWRSDGPPLAPELVEAYWRYYVWTHSLVVLTAATAIVALTRYRRWCWLAVPYALHILMDLPTHERYEGRPFHPISDWHFIGLTWGDPRIFFPNLFALLLAIWGVNRRQKTEDRRQKIEDRRQKTEDRMSARVDVIVAGAGPAGAVAARTLALGGLDVLLVDKSRFPRNKPCGGGISTRALKRFPWLEPAIAGIDVHVTRRLHLESPNGQMLELRSEDPAVILVRRLAFDHALVSAATAAGARLEEGAEITQAEEHSDHVVLRTRDGRTFEAPLAIAADGVHSVVAKRLGVRKQWPERSIAIDMMEESPNATLRSNDPDVLWVAYAYRGMEGYAYVFPKRAHVNVGIGCLLSDFDRDANGHPYLMQSRFVSELVSSGVLSGQSDRRHFTPFLIPVGGPMRRPHTRRVLFCGDAGGFVNAFTAEGIFYAMLSGELAARAAIDRPASPGPRYRTLLRAECQPELRDSVLVQRYLLSDVDRVNRVVAAGRRVDWVGDVIVGYASGRMTYAEARRKVLKASPRTLLRLAGLALRRRLNAAV